MCSRSKTVLFCFQLFSAVGGLQRKLITSVRQEKSAHRMLQTFCIVINFSWRKSVEETFRGNMSQRLHGRIAFQWSQKLDPFGIALGIIVVHYNNKSTPRNCPELARVLHHPVC